MYPTLALPRRSRKAKSCPRSQENSRGWFRIFFLTSKAKTFCHTPVSLALTMSQRLSPWVCLPSAPHPAVLLISHNAPPPHAFPYR